MQQAVQPSPTGPSDPAGALSPGERGIYVAAGLGLAVAAIRPRPNPILSLLALAAGSYLAWRGSEGSCPVKAALERNRIA